MGRLRLYRHIHSAKCEKNAFICAMKIGSVQCVFFDFVCENFQWPCQTMCYAVYQTVHCVAT